MREWILDQPELRRKLPFLSHPGHDASVRRIVAEHHPEGVGAFTANDQEVPSDA